MFLIKLSTSRASLHVHLNHKTHLQHYDVTPFEMRNLNLEYLPQPFAYSLFECFSINA